MNIPTVVAACAMAVGEFPNMRDRRPMGAETEQRERIVGWCHSVSVCVC